MVEFQGGLRVKNHGKIGELLNAPRRELPISTATVMRYASRHSAGRA
jgi:hypothetical protein